MNIKELTSDELLKLNWQVQKEIIIRSWWVFLIVIIACVGMVYFCKRRD